MLLWNSYVIVVCLILLIYVRLPQKHHNCGYKCNYIVLSENVLTYSASVCAHAHFASKACLHRKHNLCSKHKRV